MLETSPPVMDPEIWARTPVSWADEDRRLQARVLTQVAARINAGDLPPCDRPDAAGAFPHLQPLRRLLQHHCAVVDDAHAALCDALTSACMGAHHLWEDLGLSGRQEVSRLMLLAFPALHARNTQNLRWKRHLFLCLGEAMGKPGLQPPRCESCGDALACLGSAVSGKVPPVAVVPFSLSHPG